MNKGIYINKIKDLDAAYEALVSSISENRTHRDTWQKMLDNANSSENTFPINAKRDIKIAYILKEVFKRGVTMSVLEDKYTELNSKYEKLSNVIRRLKVSGLLASIRYNNQNTMTFWGLSEWIEDGDFKEEFKPLKNETPFKIVVVERL